MAFTRFSPGVYTLRNRSQTKTVLIDDKEREAMYQTMTTVVVSKIMKIDSSFIEWDSISISKIGDDKGDVVGNVAEFSG